MNGRVVILQSYLFDCDQSCWYIVLNDELVFKFSKKTNQSRYYFACLSERETFSPLLYFLLYIIHVIREWGIFNVGPWRFLWHTVTSWAAAWRTSTVATQPREPSRDLSPVTPHRWVRRISVSPPRNGSRSASPSIGPGGTPLSHGHLLTGLSHKVTSAG